jgi:hypothetical protein
VPTVPSRLTRRAAIAALAMALIASPSANGRRGEAERARFRVEG